VLTVKPGTLSTGDFIILGTSTTDFFLKLYNTITGPNCDVRVGGPSSLSDRFGVIDDSKGSTVFRVFGRPLVAATWFNVVSDENFKAATDLGVAGRFRLAAQDVALVADASPLTLPTSSVVRITSDASYNIDGIGADNLAAAQNEMSKITFINANAAFDLVLQNEDAGQTAADRIITGTGSPDTIVPNTTRELWYDSTSARWRVIQPSIKTFGGYVEIFTDFTITSETLVGVNTGGGASRDLRFAATCETGSRTFDIDITSDLQSGFGSPVVILNSGIVNGLYIASDSKIINVSFDIERGLVGTPGLHWEFSDTGAVWGSLGRVSDTTNDFKNTGTGTVVFQPYSAGSFSLNFANSGSVGPYYWLRVWNPSSWPLTTTPRAEEAFTGSESTILIRLPLASSRAGGSAITIKDIGNSAGSSFITIRTASGSADTIIYGVETTLYQITTNGGSAEFASDGSTRWLVH
jgi:hypothetical protein